MNRGNITPRPENSGGIYGYPATVMPGAAGGVNPTTPDGTVAVLGVPQSSYYAPAVFMLPYFYYYPYIGV